MNVWTLIKNVFHVLLLWLGAVGSIASIYAIQNDIVQRLSSLSISTAKSIIFTPSVYGPSIVMLPVIFIGFSLSRNLRVRGGISFRTFSKRFNPFRQTNIIYEIHTLQHLYCQIHRHTKPKRTQGLALIENDEYRTEVYDFLKQCKRILDLATGSDVAVNVKLFEHKKSGVTGNISLRESVLRTWLRVPSGRELDLREEGKLRDRENGEVFKIITGMKGHPDRMLEKAEELKKARKCVNSAYNHVFGNTGHYFICNNLPAAVRAKRFFTTSKEYDNYYKSLAVFLIHVNIPAGAPVDHQPVWGVFIIDSYDTKRFEDSIVRSIGGYMAHRFYEVLDQLT